MKELLTGNLELHTSLQMNLQLTEQLLNKMKEQEEMIRLLKADFVKQKEVLDVTYQEVRRLRKKIDSFLMW